MTRSSLSCFKANDIRGRVPDDLDDDLAVRIGRAFAQELGARSAVVGYDVRLESPGLAAAVRRGLTEAGVDVIDIGLCGTEEVYFQTFHRGVDGGIMVTASHNPKGCNGMKLVREGSRPISGETGLFAIRDRVLTEAALASVVPGHVTEDFDKSAYIDHVLSYVDPAELKPLKIVVNPGNGGAGPVLRLLEGRLPFQLIYINDEPDGNFPNGVPNPLLLENRDATTRAVRQHGADLGLAWDGDFDRCFLFDHEGRFIEGYYLVGLLAEALLAQSPGETIIHDPRLTWNTINQVATAGGRPVQSKTGHAFIKEAMRRENALYGGEMSAHHYFRRFASCDSGMIPWLLVAALLSRTGRTLADLVAERIRAFPCSGEINYRVDDVPGTIERVLAHFDPLGPILDRTDGVSLEFPDWRFNLRGSNTEPLLRLNVESRGNMDLVTQRVAEIEALVSVSRGYAEG